MVSSTAVKARTGKDWETWFELLDAAGAAKLPHREIAGLLARKHGVSSWWSQNVTVEYERARGLRELHEANDGFAVAVTRTISAPVSRIYAATADPLRRKQWFPRGAFVPSSQTKDKYFRGAWKKGLRLEMGYYAKGTGKAQIAVQIRKLAAKVDVDAQRDAWKSALNKLQKMVEK
jgi:hypothetical protein